MNIQKNKEKAIFNFETTTISKLIEKCAKGSFKIPRMQRNLVWSNSQKMQLQNSLINGYPFGLIFIYERDEKWYIIDGLQRITTIIEIYKNIFKYLPENSLKEYIQDCLNEIKLETNEFNLNDDKKIIKKMFNLLVRPIDIIMTNSKSQDRSSKIFSQHFYEINSEEIHKEKIASILFWKSLARAIYEKVDSLLELEKYKIPYIIFNGKQEQVTDLFIRINTQGTKLNQTDILRSYWSNINMIINSGSETIIEKINSNFVDMTSSLKINHEEVRSISPYDVIWYIFDNVLSINWNSHISKTFTGRSGEFSNKKIEGLDSLIYLIKLHLVIIEDTLENNLDSNNFKNEEIGHKLFDNIKSIKDVDLIIFNLKKSIDIFNSIFKPFSDYRSNKHLKNDESLLPGKSYIIAILGNIYNYILSNNGTSVKVKDFVEKYETKFILKYIYDLLAEPFKSSSSKNAFISMKDDLYLKGIKFETFKNEIISFHDKNKMNKKDIEFKIKDSIIMSYLFINLISIGDNNLKTFHYDHLIPKAKLKGFMGVASFANLSLLTIAKNLEKSDKIEKKYILQDLIYCWAEK
ncbi:MAG: DUF262 domain-containing protein, partial [Mycoplasmataceae bacterium]|nr:DUF262 domain-containing protein [Mycoplasmataceae bacterium]